MVLVRLAPRQRGDGVRGRTKASAQLAANPTREPGGTWPDGERAVCCTNVFLRYTHACPGLRPLPMLSPRRTEEFANLEGTIITCYQQGIQDPGNLALNHHPRASRKRGSGPEAPQLHEPGPQRLVEGQLLTHRLWGTGLPASVGPAWMGLCSWSVDTKPLLPCLQPDGSNLM